MPKDCVAERARLATSQEARVNKCEVCHHSASSATHQHPCCPDELRCFRMRREGTTQDSKSFVHAKCIEWEPELYYGVGCCKESHRRDHASNARR
jgi:hypothetical protein